MAIINIFTRFGDIARREVRELERLNYQKRKFEKMEEDKRIFSESDAKEKKRVEDILSEIQASIKSKNKPVEVCDPLFVATRTLLNEQGGLSIRLASHDEGVLLPAGLNSMEAMRKAFEANSLIGLLSADIAFISLTTGLLLADGVTAPAIAVVDQEGSEIGVKAKGNPNGKTLYPDENDPQYREFTRSFFAALGEARSYGDLAERVLAVLAGEGDPDGFGGVRPNVKAEEFAKVMRGLKNSKIPQDEPQLRRRVNEQLNKIQNVGSEDSIADLAIDLPDLDTLFDHTIVAENVRVMGPMICAAMFEELKVFQVVDRIVEQFQHGMLPIGPGEAGKRLYNYWREAPNRMSEQERRNFAAITLGVPGGEPGALVNREFNDLWLRFVSSVSSFVRQNEVDQLLRARTPSAISQQQVRKAARDLAGNLSLHGYGMAHYAGRELQAQIVGIISLLGDREILGAYGARDMWQVVDQVATYELGGARTSSRYRTLATCGTIITAWLANNIARINNPTGAIIDMASVRFPDNAPDHRATVNPNDYDLVNACELWLADTATSDSQVEEMAQPREAPQMTSKPIPIPAMARQMLDDIGDIGLGLGVGRPAWPNGSAVRH